MSSDSARVLTYEGLLTIAKEVAEGKNGNRFERLVSSSMMFLARVRIRFGFTSIPWKVVQEEIVSSAVGEAIVRLRDEGGNFLMYLQNFFRDECRRTLRGWRAGSLDELTAEETEGGKEFGRGICQDRNLRAKGVGPAKEVEGDEVVGLVMAELHKESEPCISVVKLWARGYGYGEIEEGLSLPADSAKNERIRNMEHMRSRIDWRHPGLSRLMRI
jgi:hypothetical protein